jgi:hypothetical protein
VAKAQEIALRYAQNETKRYQDAADALRLPFWDWAATPDMPNVVSDPTVTVRTFPNATVAQVTNPLLDYNYPSTIASGQFGPFDSSGNTRRCTAAQANGALEGSGLGFQVVRLGRGSLLLRRGQWATHQALHGPRVKTDDGGATVQRFRKGNRLPDDGEPADEWIELREPPQHGPHANQLQRRHGQP